MAVHDSVCLLEEGRALIAHQMPFNPYWDEYLQFQRLARWVVRLSDASPRLFRTYGYAIPSPTTVRFVARYLGEAGVEMGAGSGYWARLLEKEGVRITAYDRSPKRRAIQEWLLNGNGWSPYTGYGFPLDASWYPVLVGGPRTLRKHPEPLLLCFPPCGSSMADRCLDFYPGRTLVLIGLEGTPVGTRSFFDRLGAEWTKIDEHPVDTCYHGAAIGVYQRRA